MVLGKLWRIFVCSFLYIFITACGVSQSSVSTISENVEESLWGAPYEIYGLRLASFDKTELAARLYKPKAKQFPGPRPGIIFANSWVFDEFEYEMQARRLAQKGYIVLSYAGRGFGRSGGQVAVATQDDMKDISGLIDWLEANTPLDSANLGMTGLSYGAGLSLLGLAHDSRIKTAVALNGWGDLEKSLYGRDTIRQVWLTLLLKSAEFLAHLDPEVNRHADMLRTRSNIEVARKWAKDRSPITYIDAINRRQAPVFLANSYNDNLFPPEQIREFYEQLSGPKNLYMDRGIHFTSAVTGLLGLPSEIWDAAHDWLDYWLLGKSSQHGGLESQQVVSFQTPRGREYFREFPKLTAGVSNLKLRTLNRLVTSRDRENKWIHFNSAWDSGATTGIPLLSDLASSHLNIPVIKGIDFIHKRHAAVYISQHFDTVGRVRGAPRLKFWLAPHERANQLVAYLYDVNSFGIGTLVTHGVLTEHDQRQEASEITLDLNVAAYDFAAGHRLAIAVDTRDPLYGVPRSRRYDVAIAHDEDRRASLELPLVP